MNLRRWSITLMACVLLLAVLAAFKYQQIRSIMAASAAYPEPSESVQALQVQPELREVYVSTIGEVLSPDAIVLRNELEGRIAEVIMVSGQDVRAGDVLLRLDTSEERARLKAAQANANIAALHFKRQEKLLGSGTASQDVVDQARAQYDVAQANVAELDAIIAKKTLVAPFDAVVGLHDLDPGEYIGANTALVDLVGRGDYLWVDFNLPLLQATPAVGALVKIRVQGDDAQMHDARIIASNTALSADSRNLRYRAQLARSAGIAPHAVVTVLVPAGSASQILVPLPAVMRDELGAYVFRLEPDPDAKGYRAHRQSVQLGQEIAQKLAIVGGLEAGTLIATDGAFKLNEGMLAFVRERPDASKKEAAKENAATPATGDMGSSG